MYAEIRHDYIWGPAVESGSKSEEDGDILAGVSIDGWKTSWDDEQGSVIANVILTRCGDIVVDFHDNGARMDAQVKDAIAKAKDTLKKIWDEGKGRPSRQPKGREQSVEYRNTLYLSDAARKTIEGFLNAKSEDEYQGGDNTITYTVRFPDGKEMDVKCCGCQEESSWTEAVLFDEKGCQLTYTDVSDEFIGTWELTYKDATYIVEVKVSDSGAEIQP